MAVLARVPVQRSGLAAAGEEARAAWRHAIGRRDVEDVWRDAEAWGRVQLRLVPASSCIVGSGSVGADDLEQVEALGPGRAFELPRLVRLGHAYHVVPGDAALAVAEAGGEEAPAGTLRARILEVPKLAEVVAPRRRVDRQRMLDEALTRGGAAVRSALRALLAADDYDSQDVALLRAGAGTLRLLPAEAPPVALWAAGELYAAPRLRDAETLLRAEALGCATSRPSTAKEAWEMLAVAAARATEAASLLEWDVEPTVLAPMPPELKGLQRDDMRGAMAAWERLVGGEPMGLSDAAQALALLQRGTLVEWMAERWA